MLSKALKKSAQTGPLHRIDLVFPSGQTFFLPFDQKIKGKDVVDFCSNFDVSDFIVCRNSAQPNKYDILFSKDTGKCLVSPNITDDFITSPITNFFVPDRNVTSKQQRMPLFIFEIDEFLQQYAITNQNIPLSQFTRKHQRIKLRVSVQSTQQIIIETKVSKKISSIHKLVHKELISLFGEDQAKSANNWRFGTMKGEYPKKNLLFSECPEMLESYRLQQLDPDNPYFVYTRIAKETEFTKTSLNYIQDLELKPIIQSPEVLCFNSQFSILRTDVETARTARLEEQPLLARTRINELDPPLTTCKKKNVPIKCDTRQVAISEDSTAISIAVDFKTTATEAICRLFNKMQSMQGIGEGLEPNNYALVLQGTDEVVAGDFPMDSFVCVRQFLLSVTPFMNFLLVDKNDLISQIREKELSYRALPEPKEDQLYTPLVFPENSENAQKTSFEKMAGLPHLLANEKLSITIGGCFHIPESIAGDRYVVRVVLIHGSTEISAPATTRPSCGGTSVMFNETLLLGIQISHVPRAARIAITLYKDDKDSKKTAVATINVPVFRFDGWFSSGVSLRSMWNSHDTDPLLTTCQCEDDTAVRVLFKIPEYFYPIAHTFGTSLPKPAKPVKPGSAEAGAVSSLKARKYDLLKPVPKKDLKDFYRYRHSFSDESRFLPVVLSSIDYTDPLQVNEIPLLLEKWQKPTPTEALSLLDSQFADFRVRKYAVQCLETLTDDEIMLYMLQLVQALKYEMYDDSPICRFLFRRGLNEPKFLGHQLFWQLMSEAHVSHIRRRFSSFVVNFLYGSGIYREELLKGYKFTQELVKLNHRLCKLSHSEASEKFREALKTIDLPNEFHLPMDPRLIVDRFIVDKCKVMNSKKKPFWLTFHNAAPFSTEPVRTMFKVGDDLRQDQLTLQVMKVMEHLWRKEGLDLHMRCYGVLPTGFNQGFIEVVPNAITEQALQQERGTFSGIWDQTTISDYLCKVNQTEQNQNLARMNFMFSSAGYAVATCVLGIADRHPGNIMLQSDGHYLHIDFGHFLGNFKTKLGYQRENAPYHFSPACAYVLGDVNSKMFEEYKELCGKALNTLRHNAKLLVTLFLLMLGTGIPELQKPEDIRYLTNMLFLDKTDEEAKLEFDKLTILSLESTRTKLNNLFHNIAVSG